jgi:hypothetical protein
MEAAMTKRRVLAQVAAALFVLGAAAAAQTAQPVKLAEEALKLDVRFEGKMTTGAKVDTQLRPLVRQALNEWAAVAARLDLDVTVPKSADALILGRAPEATLIEAASWVDKTGALLEGLKPSVVGAGEARPPHAIVVALFDEQGFKSEAWPGLLDTLVARRDLLPAFAEQMKREPGSFTVRNASFFAQHTFDMAGNAESGDDEYRFENEIVHKTAQYLVEARFGRQPDVVRWGMGYVAEQRLRGAIYQFNASGFVASEDHFGWPEKTRNLLASRAKSDAFSLSDTILRTSAAGTPEFGQQVAWATLEYELSKEPQKLAGLLTQLGALDKEADPKATRLEYCGDEQRAHDACAGTWDPLKPTALVAYLKKMK